MLFCLAALFASQPTEWREQWKSESNASQLLTENFERMVSSDTSASLMILDSARDDLRDFLYSQDPTEFPRHGQVGTTVTDILPSFLHEDSVRSHPHLHSMRMAN